MIADFRFLEVRSRLSLEEKNGVWALEPQNAVAYMALRSIGWRGGCCHGFMRLLLDALYYKIQDKVQIVHMDQREEWNRAKWASRRGLLELDLLLSPFVESRFIELEASLRGLYREFLYEGDQDLLEWIMQRAQLRDPRFRPVVEAIRTFHQLDD